MPRVASESREFLSPQEQKAIVAFLFGLKKRKELLEKLVLFGSKARGDYRKDSDIDLLAVVKRRSAEEGIYEEVANVLSVFGVYLSVKTFPRNEFEDLIRLKTPFIENINKEGIVLWPKQ
jgi:predicted nucleotidyltransferase